MEALEPITRGPINEMRRLSRLLDVHGISSELMKPEDLNCSS